MYDRRYGEQELNFEASGALMKASLVMRDKETDSWWSIMTSDAIGGEMEGAPLVELPLGEKSPWGNWRARHPDTLILSIDGREHDLSDGYAGYWTTERTFRNLEIDDLRLKPKAPIYSFWFDGEPFAVAHKTFTGGRFFDLTGGGHRIYLYRERGSSMFASTRAFLVLGNLDAKKRDSEAVLAELQEDGSPTLGGFDTFWYSWVVINENTHLLK